MKKGLHYPTTVEEARKRIKTDLTQIYRSREIQDDGSFDRLVTYRYPIPQGAPPSIREMCGTMQAELDRIREKLSKRVERFYRRSQRISLVCDLLRQSPIFLRDAWVTDLLIELKRTATLDPKIEERRIAINRLRDLSMAISSERLPSGQWRRAEKWRKLRPDRPRPHWLRVAGLINRYNCYLDLGVCLREFWSLTASDRCQAGISSQEFQASRAGELKVPVEWLVECSKGRTQLHQWTLQRIADEEGTTPDAVRGQIEHARAADKERLEDYRAVSEAMQRLQADRKLRAHEQLSKGRKTGFLRRY